MCSSVRPSSEVSVTEMRAENDLMFHTSAHTPWYIFISRLRSEFYDDEKSSGCWFFHSFTAEDDTNPAKKTFSQGRASVANDCISISL